MIDSNALKPVWNTYQITRDCLKVAQRSVIKEKTDLLNRTRFVGAQKKEADGWILRSCSESDDLVIISLWAIFERIIIQYVQEQTKAVLNEDANKFKHKVHKKIENEIEYWKAKDILDLFKESVDKNLLGNAKQIKRYRDWVAHKNIKKGQPANVSPQTAYRILAAILEEIEKLDDN